MKQIVQAKQSLNCKQNKFQWKSQSKSLSNVVKLKSNKNQSNEIKLNQNYKYQMI